VTPPKSGLVGFAAVSVDASLMVWRQHDAAEFCRQPRADRVGFEPIQAPRQMSPMFFEDAQGQPGKRVFIDYVEQLIAVEPLISTFGLFHVCAQRGDGLVNTRPVGSRVLMLSLYSNVCRVASSY